MKRFLLPARNRVFAGAFALALAAGALVADPGNGRCWNGPGGGVGTLPSTASGGPGLPGATSEASEASGLMARTPDRGPALALLGTEAELDQLIAQVYSPDGSGWYHVSTDAEGTQTVTFYGNVVLLLERSALRAHRFAPALALEPSVEGGGVRTVLTSAEGSSRAGILTPGLTPLALDRAVGQGLLAPNGKGLELTALARDGSAVARFHFAADGQQIRIEQHP
jgi:hypothetical protein